jgi:ketosteroid isomerase-like protein
MVRPLAGLAVIAVLSGGCGSGSGQPGTGITAQASDATATAKVRAVLDKYVQAVKSADENLLREVWAQGENVSYVNPMQRLRSWGELQGFWQGFLKNSFTQRELTLNNVAIQASGDVAWVVFDWEFSGIQTDGKPSRSRGWETQVYQRTDRGWRMRHAHYSVPVTPPPTGAQVGQ